MACCFSLGFLIQIHPKNASLLEIFWAPCPPFPPLSLLCPHSPFPLPSLRFLYDDSTGTTRQGCSLVKLPMALNFILLFCDSRILWCWWAVIIRGHMLQPPCGSPTNTISYLWEGHPCCVGCLGPERLRVIALHY